MPPVGSFFVSSTGFGANLSAKLLSRLVQWGTDSVVNHAGIYVGEVNGVHSVVEAQPGGARYAPVEQYLDENTFWDWSYLQDLGQGDDIAFAAEKMVGVPYGYLDIIAIAIAQPRFERMFGDAIDSLHPWEKQPWWVKRLCRKDRLICSQLVDEAYRLGGIHLFNDGRLPQLVSPGDLHRLIMETARKDSRV
jgi:cell wall-associated NlpC family hydrolase